MDANISAEWSLLSESALHANTLALGADMGPCGFKA